jgi:hypothetical protein
MFEPQDIEAALAPVADVLEGLPAPYYIGGSVASSNYGKGRSTYDLDVIADLNAEHIDPLIDALKREYYTSRSAMQDAVARRATFNLIHFKTSVKVDVFCSKRRPYDLESLRRIRQDSLSGAATERKYCFASPEDVVIAKLEWFRLGDEVATKQLDDVKWILQLQASDLEQEYLEHWTRELGVDDLLRQVAASLSTDPDDQQIP